MTQTRASILSGQTAISNSVATALGTLPDNHPGLRNGVTVRNATGNAVIWVGGPGVAAATGYPLLAGESIKIEASSPEYVFAIATTDTQKLEWIGV